MAASQDPARSGAGPRPPVILLVLPQGTHQPALEEALRAAGLVLICADPDAAPGFLEASEWPGVHVTMPDLVLTVGPQGLHREFLTRSIPLPTLAVTTVPNDSALQGLVGQVLEKIGRAHLPKRPGTEEPQ